MNARALALAFCVVVALCTTPSVQAWKVAGMDIDYEGPVDEIVTPLLDDVCIPGAGVSGDYPFLVVDDTCFAGESASPPGNNTPSPPPPESPDNSTGGP